LAKISGESNGVSSSVWRRRRRRRHHNSSIAHNDMWRHVSGGIIAKSISSCNIYQHQQRRRIESWRQRKQWRYRSGVIGSGGVAAAALSSKYRKR